jgi:hypothetical protein
MRRHGNLFHGESPRKSKITNLDIAIVVDEDICWLYITMNKVGRVNEV